MAKTRITVRIAGRDYPISSNDTEEYVRRVARYVDRKITELSKATRLPVPDCATLAAVTIGSGMLGITGIMLGVPLTAFGYRWLQETVRAREAQAGEKAGTEEKTGAPDDGTGEQEKACRPPESRTAG